MSMCSRAEALRDYAFNELAPNERRAMEQHLAGCAECAGELDQLRVTTAALRALPDREMPRRIAFVSDKVFSPSPIARFFNARLGFLSACAMAAGLIVFAYHRPAEIHTTVVQSSTAAMPAGVTQAEITKQVNDAVAKAVLQVRAEDAESTKLLVASINRERRKEQQGLMEAVTVLQDRVNASTLLAGLDRRETGAGQ